LDTNILFEAQILISGQVQGVGFRPFIYRLANVHGLKGNVINRGDAGVEILVEGSKDKIKDFISSIKNEAPSVSEIKKIKVKFKPFKNKYNEFKIEKSRNGNDPISGNFPPDIGICPECLKDLENPKSRWYEYPFTACAWCGPRFTGINSLPYDRERTHMEEFTLCETCFEDYYNPLDRRFDAQGITCPKCGPKISLYDSFGSQIETKDIFGETGKLLFEGKIVAVKGIGGIHLAAIATEDEVIKKLRSRKERPFQPFALMSPNIEQALKFIDPNKNELDALTSWRKPIVLIKKKGSIISELVAPGLDKVGVMLPYSGIQVMIFKKITTPALIMTSGNSSGLPMSISNDEAFRNLNKIADYFLLHNRKILNRCDDSVLRINNRKRVFLRRSRGYIPEPIKIPFLKGVAYGIGAEQANAAAITKNNKCYMTQFLGDISTLESLDYEKEAINTMCDLFRIREKPDVISCDNNPSYMTSQLAEKISQEKDTKIIKTQHHHAHIVSACAENGINPDEKVIGVALDGAGYGSDSNIWGCEVLISTFFDYERVGHLNNLPLPGGDLSAIYPYRMLIASLSQIFSKSEICDITNNHIDEALPNGEEELELILKQCKSDNVKYTSSAGRFLDSISALLGLSYKRTYEGEPAMKLESHALFGKENRDINVDIDFKNQIYQLNTKNLLKYFVINLKSLKSNNIALITQKYLAKGIFEIVLNVSDRENINTVAISGGVFANQYISNSILKKLHKNNKKVVFNIKCPPGDGGIALGQTCIGLSNVM
jgi:hydrogenase maturation protein HypF